MASIIQMFKDARDFRAAGKAKNLKAQQRQYFSDSLKRAGLDSNVEESLRPYLTAEVIAAAATKIEKAVRAARGLELATEIGGYAASAVAGYGVGQATLFATRNSWAAAAAGFLTAGAGVVATVRYGSEDIVAAARKKAVTDVICELYKQDASAPASLPPPEWDDSVPAPGVKGP